jgi:phenylacetate-coenzyme A ligase PaaK-like adenylate-forming protein
MTATTLSAADRLRALAAEQIERDGWSREQLLAHQHERLSALLAHARERSPYYRDALDPHADFASLPTLSKATLMEEWGRIVCDPRLTREAAFAHAAGADAAALLHGDFEIFSTSGASGMRGIFAYSRGDWATAMASTLRGMARMGVRAGDRVVGIGGPGGVHMSKRIYAGFQATRGDAPELSALTPVPEMVAALNAYRPDALVGYSSVGALLAAEQLAGRLDIAPRAVAFGSEPLTPEMRDRIAAAWGIDPCEYYVSTEQPVMAMSKPDHPRVLEVMEDLVVLETVDEENRPAPPGTAGAKVLVTNLENRTLPLIRYELADRVTLSAEPNPTGRPYRHLAAIDGRTADTLTFPARGGGEVAVLPLRFGGPFARLPDVRQFQIVHEAGALEVRVVGKTDGVAAAVAAALADAGAVVPEIRVTPVMELEREPGAAAKLKLVVAR